MPGDQEVAWRNELAKSHHEWLGGDRSTALVKTLMVLSERSSLTGMDSLGHFLKIFQEGLWNEDSSEGAGSSDFSEWFMAYGHGERAFKKRYGADSSIDRKNWCDNKSEIS